MSAIVPANETPNHRTTRDKLVYELLGDIGRVYDEIKALNERVEVLPANLDNALKPMSGAIAKTLRDAHAGIGQYGKDVCGVIQEFAAHEAKKAAQEMLAAVAADLKAATALHKKAVAEASGKRWVWVGWAAVVGLSASALGATGAIYAYSYLHAEAAAETAYQAKYGRALVAAWPSLDEKTKSKIVAAGDSLNASTEPLRREK